MSDGQYPAFPVTAGQTVYAHGMALRDWFAGQALAGAVSDPSMVINNDELRKALAEGIYKMADAMLEARDK